jgi:hypothetical protein
VCLRLTIEKTLAYWPFSVDYDSAMFYATGPWGRCYKTNYVRIYLRSIVS